MTQLALAARVRTETGKGAARRLRQNKQVPAIFYGPGADPVMLTLEEVHLLRLEKAGKGENAILDLKIETDQGEIVKKVMVKELVIDPVKNNFIHADFYEISNDRELTLPIHVRLQGIPKGGHGWWWYFAADQERTRYLLFSGQAHRRPGCGYFRFGRRGKSAYSGSPASRGCSGRG